jgi:hypothetical protein
MSAHNVYDKAPLGSLIRYSDGTPKPRARFNKSSPRGKIATVSRGWSRKNRSTIGRPIRQDRP